MIYKELSRCTPYCRSAKKIYVRDIKERIVREELKIYKGKGKYPFRSSFRYRMRWVKVGEFCSKCFHIDIDPEWLEQQNKPKLIQQQQQKRIPLTELPRMKERNK